MSTTATGAAQTTTLQDAETSSVSAFNLLAAWAVFLIIMWGIAQTRTGEVIIYDALLLLIVLIIVKNSGSIVSLLQPLSGLSPAGAAQAS